MATQDEEIARYLREAEASGELRRLPGYGKPLPEDDGFEATPDDFRMPFKILKNAGFAPPEIEWFRQRAALQAELQAARGPEERAVLAAKLSDLQQKIALRLEAMRVRGTV